MVTSERTAGSASKIAEFASMRIDRTSNALKEDDTSHRRKIGAEAQQVQDQRIRQLEVEVEAERLRCRELELALERARGGCDVKIGSLANVLLQALVQDPDQAWFENPA